MEKVAVIVIFSEFSVWVSDCYLMSNEPIFQLYHVENKLPSMVDMSLHSDTLSWFWVRALQYDQNNHICDLLL
jgi:hypothetical protein